ncbi:MAG: MetQ/NlpA family ABC transporter substrate-binding protein [Lagierella massiliensis]|nr:MetQ/NlpA family ABC transporter substrate-binding protein [Lagierella massiliensis]
MKKKIFYTLLAVSVIVLTGCKNGNVSESSNGEDSTDINIVKVGATAVPHGEILEGLEEEFEKEGIKVEIVPFDDYIMPNTALEEKTIDANYFQHKQYLEQQKEEFDYDFVVAGEIHSEPMGIYSTKYKSLEELPDGAEVIIPDDVSNGARALQLLEREGLIKLKDSNDIKATEKDIVENNKNLKFTIVEAANIPNTYQDVDLGIINSNYALQVGLNPLEDSLAIEGNDTPFVNCIVVRNGDENLENIKKLVKVLTSKESADFIKDKYKGAVVPAF